MNTRFAGVLAGAALFVLLPWPTHAQVDGANSSCFPDGTPNADELVQRGLKNSPRLLVLEKELALIESERRQSRFPLSNPTMSAEASLWGGRGAVSLAQPLEPPGVRPALTKERELASETLKSEFSRARLELARDVRFSVATLLSTHRASELLEDSADLSSRLTQAVESKLAVGEASALDVHLARLGEVQAVAAVLAARHEEADAAAVLSTLAGCVVEANQLLGLSSLGPDASTSDSNRATSSASLRITGANQRLDQAKAARRLSVLQGRPDFEVGVFLEVEDGVTFAGPSLSVELPTFNRNQNGRVAGRHEVAIAEAELRRAQSATEVERHWAEQRLERTRELTARLADDPMAEAREALASVEHGYRAGELDLPRTLLLKTQVLEGQLAVLQVELAAAQAELDMALALESMELLGGAAR